MSKAGDLIYKIKEAGNITTGFGIHDHPEDRIRWRNEDAINDTVKILLGRRLSEKELDALDTIAVLSLIIKELYKIEVLLNNREEIGLEEPPVRRDRGGGRRDANTTALIRREMTSLSRYLIEPGDDDDEQLDTTSIQLLILFKTVANIGTILNIPISQVKDSILDNEKTWRTILVEIRKLIKDYLGSDYDTYRMISDKIIADRLGSVSAFGSKRGTERAIKGVLKRWKAKRARKKAKQKGYAPPDPSKRPEPTHRYYQSDYY